MRTSLTNQQNSYKNKSLINQQPNNTKPKMNLISGELVALINGLIESIKEYYQVSLSNNSDANNIFLFYKEEEQKVQNLLNEIINNNQYQKINEVFDEFNIMNKIIVQLQDNSNSFIQNLNLFFEDAKIIIKKIREQRQRQITENNSKMNDEKHLKTNSLRQMELDSNSMTQINQLYIQILQSLNKFADFIYIIEGYDSDSAKYYSNLQDFIKKDLHALFNIINQNKTSKTSIFTAEHNGTRSKSIGKDLNREIERLKKLNLSKDIKINQLMIQFNNLKTNYTEGNNINFQPLNTDGNEKTKIRELEKIINDKDMKLRSLTNRLKTTKLDNIQNTIAEKDSEIFNLKQQLSIYEQNELKFNKQLDDLNSQFQNKSMQYERQINILKNNLSKYINNNNQQLLQKNNFNMDSNTISRSDNNLNLNFQNNLEDIKNQYSSNLGVGNNKNMNLAKIIKQQNFTINKLQKEILSYKNQIVQNEQLNKRKIEEMNNNIYKNNKIIEQKEEIIKKLREKIEIPNSQININMSNQSNSNEILLLKLENEKLQKEIALLKLSPQNNNNINSLYTNNFKELQQLNIKYMEENNSLKIKIAQMEQEINKLTSKNEELNLLNNQQKDKISDLDAEITKKKEQIEVMQEFIAKLQFKLENQDFIVPRTRSDSKVQKKDSGLSKDPNEVYTKKIENLLDLLNKANKDISLLQNKNKELQLKLDDKNAEEELSGFRTEDNNFSNYEEEFDLRKMINGAKDKNRSEDINIDYPGMQGVKDKNKELQQRMNMLIEQVKILISNINCNNAKIKPQINQLCQLMRIPAKNIPLIIAGKKKKQILGLVD